MAEVRRALTTVAQQLLWWSSTRVGLGSIFVLGILIRVWLAPKEGFPGDLIVHQGWENQLATQDWSQFVEIRTFILYPFLYLFYAAGQFSRLVLGTAPSWTMMKVPGILADFGLAWVTLELADRLTPAGIKAKFPVRGLAAAAILLNPAVFFVSALWGQVDSIAALLVMGSLLLIAGGPARLYREVGATVLFALAMEAKPQVAVILPIALLVLVRRHLPPLRPIDWRRMAPATARVGGLVVVMLAVILLVPAPFGLDPGGVVYYYSHAPTYAFTSVNAFNFWGVLGFWIPDLVGSNAYSILGIPAFWFGLLLFTSGSVALLVRGWRALAARQGDGRVLVFGFAAFTLLEFAVLTRIHERYLFYAIPPLAVFLAYRPMRRAFVALSGLLLINLYFPYVFFVELYGQHTFVKIDFLYNILFGVDQDSPQKKVLSLVTGIVCVAVAWLGWRWLGPVSTTAEAAEAAPTEAATSVGRRLDAAAGVAAGAAAGARVWLSVTSWWRGRQWRDRLFPASAATESVRREAAPLWRRLAPLSLVAFACGFNLWALNPEATPVHDLNDSSYHFAMLRWARAAIDQGRMPLDGWYPNLGLGLAQFHHYQSFPHVVGAYFSIFTDPATTFYWALYLLLALWPISVYLCARWMGWDSWTGAAAALASPILISVTGYGYEHGSYTWRGYGTWSQLWGMWLLPLAWGLSWRAVKGVGSMALGALAVALTVACHLLTGYLALLSIGVWILVGWSQFWARLRRAIAVGVGAVLVGSWVIVPLLVDSAYAAPTRSGTGPTIFYDSYGAPKILGWLVSGQLFDNGRLPIVTSLVAVGLAVCLARFRRDERARAVVGVWLLSLLLLFGRPTLGPLLKLFPGSDDLPLHRFINGVHLGGILLAGIGAVWLATLAIKLARRYLTVVKPEFVAAALALVGVAGLYPAWSQVATIDQQDAVWIPQQLAADSTDGADFAALIDKVKGLPPGRVYAGSSSNWGQDYKIGYVPMFAELQNFDVDNIGFWLRVESLSGDVEDRFDETNLAQYDLFNVRYIIVPAGRPAPVKATFLAASGRHRLYQVDTSGYMQVVDSINPPIVANRTNIGDQTSAFLESRLLTVHLHPLIAFNGAAAPNASLAAGGGVDASAGSVSDEISHPELGTFSALATTNRPAMVMLKSTFDPRWHATVDGQKIKTQLIAPSFVSVPVPAGAHIVAFKYEPYPWYPELILVGFLTLVALQFRPRVNARWLRAGLRPKGD